MISLTLRTRLCSLRNVQQRAHLDRAPPSLDVTDGTHAYRPQNGSNWLPTLAFTPGNTVSCLLRGDTNGNVTPWFASPGQSPALNDLWVRLQDGASAF